MIPTHFGVRRTHYISSVLLLLLSACGGGGSPTAPGENELSNEVEEAAEAFCDSVAELPEAQCFALTFLYAATNGDNWTNNAGWMVTRTPCSWFGVTCVGSQITELVLVSNRLVGFMPFALQGLGPINVIRLGDNQLSGVVPPNLWTLGALTTLGLAYNQLTGSIPPTISVNLTVLGLRNNRFTGSIPAGLGNLRGLGLLSLSGNQLTGPIPAELGNLPLGVLLLHDNQLSGVVPLSVAQLGGQLDNRPPPTNPGIPVRCRFDSNPGVSIPNSQDYVAADLNGDGAICGVPLM